MFVIHIFISLLLFYSTQSQCQTNIIDNNIYVVAEKLEENESNNSNKLIIDLKQKNSQSLRIFDLLQSTSGINVNNTGSRLGPTSVNIRGNNANHTLVLIDGIRANNPITPGRRFRFEHLTTNNIERIEIIKGGSSVLHGSDAIGGVINIITKKGSKKKRQINFHQSFGSFNTVSTRANSSGNLSKVNYSLGLERENSKGFTAITQNKFNPENDGYKLLALNTKLNSKLSNQTNIELSGKFIKNRIELDDSFSSNSDDPNYSSTTTDYYGHMMLQTSLLKGLDRSKITIGYSKYLHNDHNLPDHINSYESYNRSKAQRFTTQLKSIFYISSSNTTRVGLEYEKEEGEIAYMFAGSKSHFSPPALNQYSGFIHHDFNDGKKFASLGARLHFSPSFKTQKALQIRNGFYFFNQELELFGGISTAFKNPSLFQLYSQYGNTQLKPETSRSLELGIKQKMNSKIHSSITLFSNKTKQVIDAPPPSYKFHNVSKTKTYGIELISTVYFSSSLSLNMQYTNLRSKNLTDNLSPVRLPNSSLTSTLNYNPNNKIYSSLSLFYKGKRDDYELIPTSRIQMPSYSLMSFFSSLKLGTDTKVWLTINNVLNKDYEDIKGYQTAKRSFVIGISSVI